MKRESDYMLVAARRASDGLTVRIGYLPGAEKPFLLIYGGVAVNSYKTINRASRACLELAELSGITLSGCFCSLPETLKRSEVEKEVVILCENPMRKAAVKIF